MDCEKCKELEAENARLRAAAEALLAGLMVDWPYVAHRMNDWAPIVALRAALAVKPS
jgi:hypothetical protein